MHDLKPCKESRMRLSICEKYIGYENKIGERVVFEAKIGK